MRKISLVVVLTLCMVLLTAGVALAAHNDKGDRLSWGGCTDCHGSAPDKHTYGPHGNYTSATNNCQTCHKIHDAANAKMLPGETLTATCNYCHDLTGTSAAPYFAADIPTGDIKSAHKVFGTVAGTVYFATYGSLTIPGGDDATGGDATLDTTGTGGMSQTAFTCNSCHTPHALAANVVDPYLGESHVKETTHGIPAGTDLKIFLTNRILRKNVNGTDTGNVYGSAWCIGCHQGRDNDHAGVFNHPVNESGLGYDLLGVGMADGVSFHSGQDASTVAAEGYLLVDADNDSGIGHVNGDPRSNKWYAMVLEDALNGDAARPDGNVAYAVGVGPSCQQCHASPRDVDDAFSAGGAPTRGTFPHLSTTNALLAEDGDDFCTNCHGISNLP